LSDRAHTGHLDLRSSDLPWSRQWFRDLVQAAAVLVPVPVRRP
jgi:hypothetical protein